MIKILAEANQEALLGLHYKIHEHDASRRGRLNGGSRSRPLTSGKMRRPQYLVPIRLVCMHAEDLEGRKGTAWLTDV